MLPGALIGRRPDRVLGTAAAVVAAGLAVLAVTQWLSGRAGEVVTVPGLWLPGMLWWLGWPALVIAAVAKSTSLDPPQMAPPRRVAAGRFAVVAFVLAGDPLLAHLFMAPLVFGYMSYDTTPWADAITGGLLIAASVSLWLTSYPAPVPDSGGGATVPQRARLTRAS